MPLLKKPKSKRKPPKKNPFRASKIVPDVIDVPPKLQLEITYLEDQKVDNGNVLTPSLVKNPPNVTWTVDRKSDDLFLLAMVDPDSPTRMIPEFREWHHWLVGNIPRNEIEKGEVLSEYIGACPPKSTGLHRYVFLVYKQPEALKFDEPRLSNTSGNCRAMFSIRSFAQKYNLGDPVIGNFFQAEWDAYVPILYKQLRGEFIDS